MPFCMCRSIYAFLNITMAIRFPVPRPLRSLCANWAYRRSKPGGLDRHSCVPPDRRDFSRMERIVLSDRLSPLEDRARDQSMLGAMTVKTKASLVVVGAVETAPRRRVIR